MSGDGKDFEILTGTTIIERSMKLEQIISEKEVRNFNTKSRRCLFPDEPQSKYFSVWLMSRRQCKIKIKISKHSLRRTPEIYARWIVESDVHWRFAAACHSFMLFRAWKFAISTECCVWRDMQTKRNSTRIIPAARIGTTQTTALVSAYARLW